MSDDGQFLRAPQIGRRSVCTHCGTITLPAFEDLHAAVCVGLALDTDGPHKFIGNPSGDCRRCGLPVAAPVHDGSLR